MSLILGNPILKREIEHRMRDKRTYFIPTAYLVLLGLATAAIYLTATYINGAGVPTPGYSVGSSIFAFTVVLEMILVVLLVPSLSGAAITAERERGCLVPLLVTPMSRGAITVGKLVAPVLYIFFLLSLSLPFAALSFGFGGTDLRLLGIAYGCIAASTMLFASLGLFISTLFKRTVPAVLLTYSAAALIIIGTLIADGIVNLVSHAETWFFVYINPFFALFSLLTSQMTFMNPVRWWISPVLQLVLSAVFALFAGIRISKMRD